MIDRLFIELTNACNFRCDFCPQTIQTRPKEHLRYDLYQQLIDEIATERLTRRISLHVLGEPLLHPRLLGAVAYASARGLEVDVTTNGALLTAVTVRDLAAAGLTRLKISLVTLDETQHAFRHSGLSFGRYYRRVLDAVRVARAESLHVQIALLTSWSRHFFSTASRFRLNERSTRFRRDLLELARDMFRQTGEPEVPAALRDTIQTISLRWDVKLALAEGMDIFIRVYGDWGSAFSKRTHPAIFGYCPAAWNNAAILSNGDIVPCCVDYDGQATLGRFPASSLRDVLTGPAMRAIVEGFRRCRVVHPHCARCLGSSSRLRALGKGLATIGLFRRKSPVFIRTVGASADPSKP